MLAKSKTYHWRKPLLQNLENYNASVSIIDLVDVDLPLYSSKVQAEQGMPSQLDALFDSCQSADGFVIVAPEYNGGIPPVLTNAIAWLSVKGEQWRDAFNAKVVGLASFMAVALA